jgi:plasmid stabilization system protein ParE
VRVRFTPQAARQYLEALRYLRTKNPAGAATVQRRAEAVIELLGDHPDAGYAIPEFPELAHRELPDPPYRFFHRVVDETVWIVAVWHARQRPEPPNAAARSR